jgi:hypothetical protein
VGDLIKCPKFSLDNVTKISYKKSTIDKFVMKITAAARGEPGNGRAVRATSFKNKR